MSHDQLQNHRLPTKWLSMQLERTLRKEDQTEPPREEQSRLPTAEPEVFMACKDNLKFMKSMASGSIKLIVTSWLPVP